MPEDVAALGFQVVLQVAVGEVEQLHRLLGAHLDAVRVDVAQVGEVRRVGVVLNADGARLRGAPRLGEHPLEVLRGDLQEPPVHVNRPALHEEGQVGGLWVVEGARQLLDDAIDGANWLVADLHQTAGALPFRVDGKGVRQAAKWRLPGQHLRPGAHLFIGGGQLAPDENEATLGKGSAEVRGKVGGDGFEASAAAAHFDRTAGAITGRHRGAAQFALSIPSHGPDFAGGAEQETVVHASGYGFDGDAVVAAVAAVATADICWAFLSYFDLHRSRLVAAVAIAQLTWLFAGA